MPKSPCLELVLSLDEAVHLEAALAAYDAITAGAGPDPATLALAPCLTGWRRCRVPAVEPALVGMVEGHPLLRGARRIVTSRLIALDPIAGWARTTSRYYRLHRPGD